MKTVASFDVTKILQLESKGPYLVGGWSIGGAYAYEVAWQLMALEKEVKGVV